MRRREVLRGAAALGTGAISRLATEHGQTGESEPYPSEFKDAKSMLELQLTSSPFPYESASVTFTDPDDDGQYQASVKAVDENPGPARTVRHKMLGLLATADRYLEEHTVNRRDEPPLIDKYWIELEQPDLVAVGESPADFHQEYTLSDRQQDDRREVVYRYTFEGDADDAFLDSIQITEKQTDQVANTTTEQ